MCPTHPRDRGLSAGGRCTISGCMKNSQACGLVLGIVPWSIELDHGSAWLDQADAVSPAGCATAVLGWFIPAQSSQSVEPSSKRMG